MTIEIEDERDERAWVAFATGHREHYYNGASINNTISSSARFADKMLEELKKRRKKYIHEGGPYRQPPTANPDVLEWNK